MAGGWQAFSRQGLGFLTSTDWDPVRQLFGAGPAIFGTLVTSIIALVIAVPLSFGIALFLTEICPLSLRRPLGTMVELLAAGLTGSLLGTWIGLPLALIAAVLAFGVGGAAKLAAPDDERVFEKTA